MQITGLDLMQMAGLLLGAEGAAIEARKKKRAQPAQDARYAWCTEHSFVGADPAAASKAVAEAEQAAADAEAAFAEAQRLAGEIAKDETPSVRDDVDLKPLEVPAEKLAALAAATARAQAAQVRAQAARDAALAACGGKDAYDEYTRLFAGGGRETEEGDEYVPLSRWLQDHEQISKTVETPSKEPEGGEGGYEPPEGGPPDDDQPPQEYVPPDTPN